MACGHVQESEATPGVCIFLCDCAFVLVGLLMGMKRVQVVWSTGSEGLSGVGGHGRP